MTFAASRDLQEGDLDNMLTIVSNWYAGWLRGNLVSAPFFATFY